MIELYHGDFLEKAKNIPDDSVDLVLTDPPYGTMKGFGLKQQGKSDYDWDVAVEPVVLFTEINRILRQNGKAVLFGQEPFTSRMITEAIPNLQFSYRMIWEKDDFANALVSKKAPVNYYEDVMVFSKRDGHIRHPAKDYTDKLREFIGKSNREIFSDFEEAGHARYALVDTFNSKKAMRYSVPTKETYEALIDLYQINKMEHFIAYEELKGIDAQFKQRYASTFNIWEEEPVKDYEDMMVFSKRYSTSDFENGHPLRVYFTDVLNYIGLKKSEINKIIGQRATHVFRVDSAQFDLCTERTYDDLIKEFGIDEMANFQEYAHLKKVDERYKKEIASTFNLWQKKKFKSNILKYAKDYPSLHPTMKPILLLEDLIKTFSNEGDLVVDLTMGSGSTGVACKNTGRKFIGIEMDDEYFNIAKERIETHEEQLILV